MFTMQCFRKNQGVALMLALSLSSLFGEIVPLAPADGSTFETLTDEQIAVFGGETRTNRLKIATKLKSAPKEAWQRQRPLVLTWNATEGENEPWRVRLSTRPDFSDGRDLWFDRRALARGPVEHGKPVLWTCRVPLANLELGKTYYWQVWSDVKCSEFRCGFTYPDGCACGKSKPGKISPVMSFRTSERPPRWIELEGRTDNVRDIGGWRTMDGGRVRMGMVYRGTAFNDNSVAGINRGRNRLTVEDVKYLTEELGIKTDLDLRSPREVAGMKESPLGPKVRFVNVSSETYQGLFTDVGKAAMAKNFRLFCDKANYPIYFHCIHGADRTGSLAYVLNGALGVAKEDLERVCANAYDFVLNGTELGGGSIRIHDAAMQSRMFDVLGISKEDAEYKFGFDRVCARFGGQETIRDYIAFPKNNQGRDVMIDSPSMIDDAQMEELFLASTYTPPQS